MIPSYIERSEVSGLLLGISAISIAFGCLLVALLPSRWTERTIKIGYIAVLILLLAFATNNHVVILASRLFVFGVCYPYFNQIVGHHMVVNSKNKMVGTAMPMLVQTSIGITSTVCFGTIGSNLDYSSRFSPRAALSANVQVLPRQKNS